MPDVITLGSVTLPGDLQWTDEFTWCAVERSEAKTISGASVLFESVKLAGRPITLEAGNPGAGLIWLDRATIEDLMALASTTGWEGTLTMADSQTFTVAFRDEGVIAQPVRHIAPLETGDPYALTLKLQTV
jgi:hypothetical protein